MSKIGQIGEEIIAKYLENNNYVILHQRWRCRWGEIDLIAQEKDSLMLAFVEVKTRNVRNWDNDGIFAITPQKQAKLWQTAEYFLSENPHLAELPCRFDVALLLYKNIPQNSINSLNTNIININTPIFYENYQLKITNYLKAAF